MFLRTILHAGVCLALGGTATAWAADDAPSGDRAETGDQRLVAQDDGGHQTIYELWTAGGTSDDFTVEQDGDAVVVTRDGGSWSGRLILPEDLGALGERSVAVTITIEEDGGGWPDRLVGAGFFYGFTDANAEFLFTILSPQDGGMLMVGQNVVDGGFSIAQTLGNESMAVGEAVRLVLSETDGGISVEAGGSSLSFSSSGIAALQSNADARIGIMIVGSGTYRFEDLEIE